MHIVPFQAAPSLISYPLPIVLIIGVLIVPVCPLYH